MCITVLKFCIFMCSTRYGTMSYSSHVRSVYCVCLRKMCIIIFKSPEVYTVPYTTLLYHARYTCLTLYFLLRSYFSSQKFSIKLGTRLSYGCRSRPAHVSFGIYSVVYYICLSSIEIKLNRKMFFGKQKWARAAFPGLLKAAQWETYYECHDGLRRRRNCWLFDLIQIRFACVLWMMPHVGQQIRI